VEAEGGTLRLSVSSAQVACGAGLLRQALVNLLENAIKYRRPATPPAIEVTGAAAGEGYELRVSDNGLGMAKEDAARVFEPFYRSPRTVDRPGTGLGLSIVKRVAEASGGKVAVETRLGQGATFVVRLRLGPPAPPASPPAA
jgi:signal transduction histidine kinase